MSLGRRHGSSWGENPTLLKHCEVAANTKTYQHDSSRPQAKNVRIIEITNPKDLTHHQQRVAKPQWCSKVLINCEKPSNQANESTKQGAVKGINKVYIGDCGETSSAGESNSEETVASKVNSFSSENIPSKPLQGAFVKRSKSELTPDREKVEVTELKRHCKSLVNELESVKSEIINILKEKNNYLKENGELQEYKKSYEDLELENKHLKMQLLQIMEEKKSEGKERKEFRPEVFQGRSSPDGKDNVSVKDDEEADEKKLDKKERHRFLEETLALMKLEFEEKEKDWQKKLENKRRLHEEENKENEKKMMKLQINLATTQKQLAATCLHEKVGCDGINCSTAINPRRSKEKSTRKKVACHDKNLLKKASRCTCYESPHEPPSSWLRGQNSEGVFHWKESSQLPVQQDLVLSVVKEIMRLQDLRSSIIEECQYLVSRTKK